MRIIVTKLGDRIVNELSQELTNQDINYLPDSMNINKSSISVKTNKNNLKNQNSKNKNLTQNFFLTISQNNKENTDDAIINENAKLNFSQLEFTNKPNLKGLACMNDINTIYEGKNSKKKSFRKSINFSANDEIINFSKSIIVKQKKLYLPKDIAEKYNTDEKYGYMLPDLNLNIISGSDKNEAYLNDNSKINNCNLKFFNSKNLKNNVNNRNYNLNSSSDTNIGNNIKNNQSQNYRKISNIHSYKQIPVIRDSLTLREIVRKSAQKDLANRLKAEDASKKRLKRITELEFRSDYTEASRYEKLPILFESEINIKDSALIKYINEKETISDLFLNKLKDSNKEKLKQANKICQVIFKEKEKKISAFKIHQAEILKKKEAQEAKHKKQLENMKKCLNNSSMILKDYNEKGLNKNIKRNIFEVDKNENNTNIDNVYDKINQFRKKKLY